MKMQASFAPSGYVGNGDPAPTANRAVYYTDNSDMLLRIPGRSAARGEITHKLWRDMNRKERRAVTASGQTQPLTSEH